MSGPSNHILIFTKHPVVGFAKTRLIPELGKEGAAALSRKLSEMTIGMVRQLQKVDDLLHTKIYHANPAGVPACETSLWLAPNSKEQLHEQCGKDLGDRMKKAFSDSFANGADRVVVIGTDAPDVSVDLLRRAFEELKRNDVVVGPALDGGYYLLGMRSPIADLFDGIAWSTDKVLTQTLEKAKALNLAVIQLEKLRDIDTADDLKYFKDIWSSVVSTQP